MQVNKTFNQSRFWRFLTSLYKFKPKSFTFNLLLMVLIGLTEGVGLLLLVPLLQLVGLDVQQGALSGISGYISYTFSFFGIKPTLPIVLLIYVIIISLNAYLSKLQSLKGAEVEYKFSAHLRKRLFRAVTQANWLFFVGKRSSDFAHALTYEIERIALGSSQLFFLISSLLILAVYILFALNLSGLTTGFIFFTGIVILLLLRNRTQLANISGENLSNVSKNMYSSTVKQMDGMKTIKSFNMEDRNVKVFSTLADDVSQKYRDAVWSYADVKFLFNVSSVIVLSIIVFVLVGVMTIPTAELLILIFLFVRMIPNFSNIQSCYQYIINMLPAFQTVTELEEECLNAAEHYDLDVKIEFNDSIKLKNVNFSYKRGEELTIKDINLIIKSGNITALTGLSGSGKSTIADIIMGFIKPDQGTLEIDGIIFEDQHLYSWRNRIGYVAQETYLFNDTIKNNLLIADPGADEETLLEVLKLVSADEFVLKLPYGMNTIIGDRGILLSGGERQRLALARALLRKPSLLILDEATSNLDSENEKRIMDAIEELHGQITMLIIAHRLSTIKNADQIYLVDKGVIIEAGNWNEIIVDGRHFQKLCEAQGLKVN